ncbi:MAG: hypothetical protein AMXMBFR64_52530 [Myxococcales bacterium]
MTVRTRLFGGLFHAALGAQMAATWVQQRIAPRLPFPRDTAELAQRQDWCVERLRGAIPEGAQVTAYDVQEIKADEAFRSQVARVQVDWTHGDSAGVTRALAKFAPRVTSLRDHAVYVLQKNHLKEAGVYERLASDPAVAAPRPFFAAAHAGSGHLCILMELLDGAREIPEEDGCPPELLDSAACALAALHARFWEQHDAVTNFLTVVPDPVIDWFSTLFPAGPDQALFGALLRVAWRHDGRAPVTVLHGDPRIGNILFTPRGPVLIDWQAARKGKGVFDLAYLLVLSTEPAVRRTHFTRLLDRYHAALLAGGVRDYSRDALEEDARWACLLVLAFASLPFMSAESSTTEANTPKLHAMGRAWARRMVGMVDDLDLPWIAARTGLDAAALRAAFERSNARVLEPSQGL